MHAVLSILTNAGSWLHSIGITEQWPASFLDDPAWGQRFTRWVDQGKVYVAFDANRGVLGCFRLEYADEAIWPGSHGSAVYLHSLAVWRYAAGWGIAAKMLDWAARHAEQRGADELRLDCWAGNQRLLRYYLDAGFEPRGEVDVDDGERRYTVARFAKATRGQTR